MRSIGDFISDAWRFLRRDVRSGSFNDQIGKEITGGLVATISCVETGRVLEVRDLGRNLVVNSGRNALANLLKGTTPSMYQADRFLFGSEGTVTTPVVNTAQGKQVVEGDTGISGTAVGITHASVTSPTGQPYNLSTANNRFRVTVDGGSEVMVTLNTGNTVTAEVVATAIDSAVTGLTAEATGNQVKLTSDTYGTNSRIRIGTGSNSANGVLGFTGSEDVRGDSHKAVGSTANVDANTIEFSAMLADDEANGSGSQVLSDLGLYNAAGNLMIARKTFGQITKTSSISITFRWTLDFSRT